MIIYGRSDAVLNPGGVRIGTAEIYRQVEQVDEVLESLAVGQEIAGNCRIILFVILRHGAELSEQLKLKIKQQIRQNASPHHVPAEILQVTDIPAPKAAKLPSWQYATSFTAVRSKICMPWPIPRRWKSIAD